MAEKLIKKRTKVLMLDAMGTIYKHGDDVKELLVPFIKAGNNIINEDIIKSNYTRASLGSISSEEFWNAKKDKVIQDR